MKGKRTDIETPVERELFKPGNAINLPVKTYPSSSKLGEHSGKGTSIEGPCDGKEGYHK